MRYATLERLGLPPVLLLAAALRLWRLDQNGWGNEYYGAAVRSMSTSWHNFLYAAFDPAGFVSVDKPPVALWIQVASVKLVGFHELSILVPQVLEGVAVSRRLGADAAGRPIADWVRANSQPVDPTLWRTSGPGGPLIRMRLYDLRPEAGLGVSEEGSRSWRSPVISGDPAGG